jgi:hypothetical protein
MNNLKNAKNEPNGRPSTLPNIPKTHKIINRNIPTKSNDNIKNIRTPEIQENCKKIQQFTQNN